MGATSFPCLENKTKDPTPTDTLPHQILRTKLRGWRTTHLVFLSAGYTLHNIEPGFARMVPVVRGWSDFLPTLLRNSSHYMSLLVLLFPLLAAAMGLLPGSSSLVFVISSSEFTPPMSPFANGMSHSGWPQPNVPALHLPGSNFQGQGMSFPLVFILFYFF